MPLRLFIAMAILLTAMPASAGVFDERRGQCAQCHGTGTSPTREVPSLGGQPELFVLFQLVAFRNGTRKVPVMNDMMNGMSDDDLRAAAADVAGLTPPSPPAGAGEPPRMTRGQALAEKHRCGFCHQPDFVGHDQIPRLRHQREDYLLKALRDYKGQKRFGSGAAMNEVVYPLSDSELADLAHYMAHVP
jgi:cytochrome c553